jgi:hypothetical protein
MKNLLILVLLLASVQSFGQKKKKQDEKDVQIETLTASNAALTGKLDSVTKDHQLYYTNYTTMYTALKDKVLKTDFDPAHLPVIIDSIRSNRDSLNSVLAAPIASLKDSLNMMSTQNNALKTRVDSMSTALNDYVVKSTDKKLLMAELKDLKSMLDSKMITPAEYDTKKKLVMERWQ